ncbi:type I-C CRISPR-associated protein Cas8c/Csd1 [Vagococcus elongatus]|uniref:Type I-C CRISPR-associated protein Cas8c/Csd1 n=1 Tax=Vagococcus elongatus TaxID=180344 RepID=A0A430AME4_9ENTE|nr:type I-C CRISPR-associated protein Cas8c/Csd1 [Vagococcus elongatus]RSU09123.1 type I-C CRISPR-associated protein Cas8c/Csd1 [Vagococcus elongatus]
MGWMLDLYETYEENSGQIGKVGKNRFGTDYALLPVSHVYQTAQIEVSLDFQGNFISAEVIPKEQGNTIIPCTIDSSTRSSGPVPHPLHDKLMYVAGDFSEYGGKIKKNATSYQDYLVQLKEWCEYDEGNRTIHAIYTYLKEGHLIKDLIAQGVLHEKNGELIPKWTKEHQVEGKEKPEIFKVLTGDQMSAFVRFGIFDLEHQTLKAWEDPQMFRSFVDFYQDKIEESGLCYITGISQPLTDKHASKIRYGGDMAKIISGNDSSGYTFRGRFSSKEQVATVGYDTSQKAHNALKWLITKQAQTIDGRVFLTWGKKTVEILDPMDSFLEQLEIEPVTQKEVTDDTHSVFAKQFRQAIDGYQHYLATEERVSILVLDAATPGRMSIVYYQNFEADLYLERIRHWHESCSWRHAYRRNENKEMTFYYGAPTNRDIAKAAYGSQASDQIIKNTMSRLLPSIVEGRPVPRDIVQLLVNRSSRPQGMEEWEWERTLTTACSMVRKFFQQRNEEEISMALNRESTDRNYLFGRMLAVADVLERSALASQNESRTTNAKRYMTAFSQHPMSAWKIIQENLLPYQARLGTKNVYYEKILGEIAEQFDEKDFNDKALNGKYLIGYYSQRQDIYTKNNKKEEQD